MDTQLVIASVPWTDTKSPLMAPAVLKSSLKRHGISSKCVDLNAEIRQWVYNHEHKVGLLNFMFTGQIRVQDRDHVKEMLDKMAHRLLEFRTNYIALSLLTYLSQVSTKWLCMRLKQLSPQTRIMIGGPGAFVNLESNDNFSKMLLEQKLIDHYISGDGEESLPALISGNHSHPGIDKRHWKQIDDLDSLPYPDFDDYDWSLYDHKKISITGSRGCVRKCTFCDIHEHWKKYQWRSGEKIFQEMVHQNQRYGFNHFDFSDALVNGNQKEYRKLVTLLCEHNKNQPNHKKINWTGAFIIRPQNQMTEKDWELTAKSGAMMIFAGIESFSEKIRYHMGKKFSNLDLDFALTMAKKYKVRLTLLTIIGYVTEDETLFREQTQWIEEHRHLSGDPIHMINFGSGLAILPGTWLDRNKEQLGIKLNDRNVLQDWTKEDINSTPLQRSTWHKQFKKCLEDNKFDYSISVDNHVLIENFINEKYSQRSN